MCGQTVEDGCSFLLMLVRGSVGDGEPLLGWNGATMGICIENQWGFETGRNRRSNAEGWGDRGKGRGRDCLTL